MTRRPYLSIGDVLTLLRSEFPDITISKIRFLESQGLLDPERTPSGYRKFYDEDVQRLRWILLQQREYYLPLKVIKSMLEDLGTAQGSETTVLAGDVGRDDASRQREHLPQPAMAAAPATTQVASERSALVSEASSERSHALGSAQAPSERRSSSFSQTSSFGSAESHSLPSRSFQASSRPEANRQSAGPNRSPAALQSYLSQIAAEPSNETLETSGLYDDSSHPTQGPSPAVGRIEDRTGPSEHSESHEPHEVSGASGEVPVGLSLGPTPPAPGGEDPHWSQASAPLGQGGPQRAIEEPDERGKPGRYPLPPPGTTQAEGHKVPESGPPLDRLAPEVSFEAGGYSAPFASGVAMTLEELSAASGVSPSDIGELESYGVLESRVVAGMVVYDEHALAAARLAAGFQSYGIQPRHLRLYRNAADREAGFLEQVVTPLLKQRNPEARQRAVATLDDLVRLGQSLRAILLRKALHDNTGT